MNVQHDRDEGAVMVLVALMIVVLLGVGALVIDIGAVYVEDRQLQNGADAAALAVAQDCAKTGNCGAAMTTAERYADANAKDGHADVTVVCGNGPGLTACAGAVPPAAANATGWVKVINQTETANGGNEISFVLAPVMNAAAGATREKTAIAAYGTLGRATTLNFIYSLCEWEQMGGNLATGAFPTGTSVIYSDNIEPCHGGSTPGNFGWIDANAQCRADLTVGGTVSGNTGNNSELCNPKSQYQNVEVVLPLYSSYVGQGTKAVYTVAGFVGFRITGYYLSGQDRWPSGFQCPNASGPGNGGNLRCFRGVFTRVISPGELGTGGNYGASVIKMIG